VSDAEPTASASAMPATAMPATAMPATVAGSPAAPEHFPAWRIVLWSIGGVGATVIGSLTGLMTYFYVPPETSQSAFPQYLSTKTILGLTFAGLIGYAGGLLTVAVNPFVSAWSDRSRSRLGRRKLFMLVSFLPISILSFLMFSPPVDHVSPANAAWLLAVIVLLNVFRSLYNVSAALVPEVGSSSRIIMLFSTLGAIGWVFGYIIGSQLVFMLKDALMSRGMSPVDAFRATVGGLIALSTLLVAVQVWVVDERRYGTGTSSTVPLLPALRMAFRNRTFVLYTLTNQVYFWGDGLFQGGLVYFVTIIFGLSDSMMIAFGGVILGLSFVIYPFVEPVARRTGKKALYSAALAIMTAVMLAFAFADKLPLPKDVLPWLIVALIAVPGAITGIIPGAIGNEIVREDCLRTGQPKEAMFGAAAGLITAIPGGFVGLVMPSLLLLGKSQANPAGVRAVALASAACMAAALLMLRLFYDERKLMASLEAHGYK
jgi:Na+/melibiose symporter-like transporter